VKTCDEKVGISTGESVSVSCCGKSETARGCEADDVETAAWAMLAQEVASTKQKTTMADSFRLRRWTATPHVREFPLIRQQARTVPHILKVFPKLISRRAERAKERLDRIPSRGNVRGWIERGLAGFYLLS
jgi:hypothetical protein